MKCVGGWYSLLDYLISLVMFFVVSSLCEVLVWWMLRFLGSVISFLWCICRVLCGLWCRLIGLIFVIVVIIVWCFFSECVLYR